MDDWLPKDHLARFVVDIVEQLDLLPLPKQYRGAGSAAYHPAVMLSLLVYGYATGVYSSRRIEAATLTQAPNDKQQLEPMLAVLTSLPESLGSVERLLADNGYFSAANVEHCVTAKIEPLLAAGRDRHHPHWADRCTEPPPLIEPASAMERMKHRLHTGAGRQLYGLRKQTVEPVFGIIKSAMDFRQFLLRGVAAVSGEWTLLTMAWNIKRMAVLAG